MFSPTMLQSAKFWASLPILVLALAVGATGTLSPYVFAGLGGFLALTIVICFFPIGARRATQFSFLLLLLAATKLRMRDPYQTLSGNVDAQIAFELLCYALVAAITFVNLASPSFNYRKPSLVENTLFFFALIAIASTAWSADPTVTAIRAAQLLILFIFLFVTTHLISPERLYGRFAPRWSSVSRDSR